MIHGPTSKTAVEMTRNRRLDHDDLADINDEFWEGLHEGFSGYRYLGYIGNSDRNYITDEWLLYSANKLGWTREMLAEWMCSKHGRWALDNQPMTRTAFFENVQKGDDWVRREARLGIGHVLAEGHDPSTCEHCRDR